MLLRRALEAGPIAARRLEQREGADDVGLDEVGRARDRAVDVAFGREMHDPVGPELGDRLLHRSAVADVGMQEAVVRLALDRSQRRQVAGISERIDVEDLIALVEHEVADERRTDESGAPVTITRIDCPSMVK